MSLTHSSAIHRGRGIIRPLGGLLILLLVTSSSGAVKVSQGELTKRNLTPLQLDIEQQRERLGSLDAEERRDALMRLATLRHPDASRAALSALNDTFPVVRATASAALLSLPVEESTPALLPLLNDKDEFVRKEAAYALGRTRSKSAVAPLIERLLTDKRDGVRGAAAVALGQIADEAAVVPLSGALSQTAVSGMKKSRKIKSETNDFVRRAAARSLGQIASRGGLAALIATIEDEKTAGDVRREAAFAVGLIGDPSAVPALRKVLATTDLYLSLAAHEALRKLTVAAPPR